MKDSKIETQKNSQINSYLFQSERHLSDLKPADRARIILEIEAELLKAAKDRPQFNAFNILGPPLQMTQKLKQQYGFTRNYSSTSPSRKWPLIVLLALALFLGGPILLAYYYISPFFDLNYTFFQSDFDENFDGDFDIGAGFRSSSFILKNSFTTTDPIQLSIQGHRGKSEIRWSDQNKFVRDCKFIGGHDVAFKDQSPHFELIVPDAVSYFKCRFEIPIGSSAEVVIEKGHVNLTSPSGKTTVEIDEGSVKFAPIENGEYQIKIDALDGDILGSENMPVSKKDEGIPIQIKVKKGDIEIL